MKLMDCPQDAANNMTSKVTEALGADTVTETRTVNNLNQITQNVIVDGNVTTTWDYTFDNNGNTLSKSNGTDTWYYQWNDDNRLVLVTLPGGATVAYTWDFFGRMLTRTDSSGTTLFVWDGFDCVQETDAAGNVTRYYIPRNSDRIGTLFSFDRTVSGTTSTFQVHADALGIVRAVTNSSGTVVAQLDCDAWGNLLASSYDDVPNGGCMYRFVGALGVRWDPVTDLYYMRARWYDPTLQRFIGRDPLQKSNRYAYCHNNPTSLTDTTGMTPAGEIPPESSFHSRPLSPDEQECVQEALDFIRQTPGYSGKPGTPSSILDWMDKNGRINVWTDTEYPFGLGNPTQTYAYTDLGWDDLLHASPTRRIHLSAAHLLVKDIPASRRMGCRCQMNYLLIAANLVHEQHHYSFDHFAADEPAAYGAELTFLKTAYYHELQIGNQTIAAALSSLGWEIQQDANKYAPGSPQVFPLP